VTDRPRLVGWSSLHRARRRSLTPLVADAGTLSGSMTGERLAPPAPRGAGFALTRAT